MKKYFTKYIPVEGEMQVGDIVHDTNIDDYYPYGMYLDAGIEIKKGLRRVKLFLCSRDIQVGDNVKYQGEDWEVPITVSDHIRLIKWIKGGDETIFKVIGEISPDNVWVTEGMEFDEDQIQLWATCDLISASHPVMIQPHSWNKPREEWKEGRNEGDSPQRVWYDEHWRIKCPTCKQFH